jgi:hypothetical protein
MLNLIKAILLLKKLFIETYMENLWGWWQAYLQYWWYKLVHRFYRVNSFFQLLSHYLNELLTILLSVPFPYRLFLNNLLYFFNNTYCIVNCFLKLIGLLTHNPLPYLIRCIVPNLFNLVNASNTQSDPLKNHIILHNLL